MVRCLLYTDSSASPAIPAIAAQSRPCAILAPDWLFEVKWDGFRALLYSDNYGVRLVSRNGNTFKSFPRLCEGLARDLKGRRCVLDGEIVCLDPSG
jgi:bifunctional non-homologous end joining protein LigD